MGLFEGFLSKMKLTEDYDDEDDNELYDDDEEDEVPETRRVRQRPEEKYADKHSDDDDDDIAPARPSRVSKPARPVQKSANIQNKVVSMQKNSRALEVCVIKPTNVEDGREISDTLISGRAVVLNLEGIDVDLAQRIIDFTSGACYSISGNLQKISNYIFIVTPANVDISGDFQELVSSDYKFTSGSPF